MHTKKTTIIWIWTFVPKWKYHFSVDNFFPLSINTKKHPLSDFERFVSALVTFSCAFFFASCVPPTPTLFSFGFTFSKRLFPQWRRTDVVARFKQLRQFEFLRVSCCTHTHAKLNLVAFQLKSNQHGLYQMAVFKMVNFYFTIFHINSVTLLCNYSLDVLKKMTFCLIRSTFTFFAEFFYWIMKL